MYAKILVPVDGSQASNAGLTEAIKIAKSQGSEIRLIHVVNDLILEAGYGAAIYACDAVEVLRKAGRNILDAAQTTAQHEGVETNSVLLDSVGGPASDLILGEAKACAADLVVMGTHGRRGLARLVMGSDAEAVVRACAVPVLLVHGQTSPKAVMLRAKASTGQDICAAPWL
jgi:nucleotide-binding universal stress UspA family protein